MTAFVKADEQVSHNLLQTINDQRNVEGQYTTEKRKADGNWLMVEAVTSCKQTKFIRAFFNHTLFNGEYECAGLGNTFNAQASVPINSGFGSISKIVYAIGALVLVLLIGLRWLKAVTGHHEGEKRSRASAPAFTVLLAVLSIFGFPFITDDNGENPMNMATVINWGYWLYETDAAGQYLTSDSVSAVLKSPVIVIPKNTMQKNDAVSDFLRFKLCDADNSIRDSSYNEGELAFNYSNGMISSFTQKGKCILKSDIVVNTDTLKIASTLGLLDYKMFFINQYKEAWTYLNDDTTILSNMIVAEKANTPLKNPVAFEKTQFSCANWKRYSVGGMGDDGLSEFADNAVECISQEFTRIMNKYPNVDESFYNTKIKGRGVHLCGQDTKQTVGTGSAVDAKNDEWTHNLKNENGTLQSLNDKLTSCVSESCTSNSSIRVCSAAINLYANMITNTDIINPSLMSMSNNFTAIEMPSMKFDEDGKLPFASFNIVAGTEDALLDDDFLSEVVFKIPYKNLAVANNYSRAEHVLDTYYVPDINIKQVLQAPLKVLTQGDDGLFGFKKAQDCMDYPNQIAPSGRACTSPFNEIAQQGARLVRKGVQLKAGAYLAGTKRNAAERNLEAAAIGATKTVLTKANLMGSGVLVGKLLGATEIDSALSNYDETGDIDATTTLALGFAYNIPSLKSIIHSVANTAIATGLFMSFAQQLNIFITNLSIYLNSIYAYVFYAITFMLYFILLLSRNNGVNPTTDWFEPFDRMVKSYLTLIIYPIVFKHSVIYIKALFYFQAINVQAMMNTNGGIEPHVNTLGQLPQLLWTGIISITIPLLLIGGFLSYTRKSPQLVASIGFGNTKEKYEENLGFNLKKLDL